MPMNALVEQHRQQFPNDIRSDEEINSDYINRIGADALVSGGYDDAVDDYQQGLQRKRAIGRSMWGELKRGVSSGLPVAQAKFGSALAMAGNVADLDSLEEWGMDYYKSKMQEAATKPANAISDVTIAKPTEYGLWLAGMVGQQIPQLGAQAAGAAAGAAIGGVATIPFGGGGALPGATAGLFGSSFAQNQIYAELIEAGVDPERAAKYAASGGVGAAVLDSIPGMFAAAKALRIAGKIGGAAVAGSKSTQRMLANAFVLGPFAEGGTEAGQAYTEILTEELARANDPNYKGISKRELTRRILNEAAAGAVLGAGFGAPQLLQDQAQARSDAEAESQKTVEDADKQSVADARRRQEKREAREGKVPPDPTGDPDRDLEEEHRTEGSTWSSLGKRRDKEAATQEMWEQLLNRREREAATRDLHTQVSTEGVRTPVDELLDKERVGDDGLTNEEREYLDNQREEVRRAGKAERARKAATARPRPQPVNPKHIPVDERVGDDGLTNEEREYLDNQREEVRRAGKAERARKAATARPQPQPVNPKHIPAIAEDLVPRLLASPHPGANMKGRMIRQMLSRGDLDNVAALMDLVPDPSAKNMPDLYRHVPVPVYAKGLSSEQTTDTTAEPIESAQTLLERFVNATAPLITESQATADASSAVAVDEETETMVDAVVNAAKTSQAAEGDALKVTFTTPKKKATPKKSAKAKKTTRQAIKKVAKELEKQSKKATTKTQKDKLTLKRAQLKKVVDAANAELADEQANSPAGDPVHDEDPTVLDFGVESETPHYKGVPKVVIERHGGERTVEQLEADKDEKRTSLTALLEHQADLEKMSLEEIISRVRHMLKEGGISAKIKKHRPDEAPNFKESPSALARVEALRSLDFVFREYGSLDALEEQVSRKEDADGNPVDEDVISEERRKVKQLLVHALIDMFQVREKSAFRYDTSRGEALTPSDLEFPPQPPRASGRQRTSTVLTPPRAMNAVPKRASAQSADAIVNHAAYRLFRGGYPRSNKTRSWTHRVVMIKNKAGQRFLTTLYADTTRKIGKDPVMMMTDPAKVADIKRKNWGTNAVKMALNGWKFVESYHIDMPRVDWVQQFTDKEAATWRSQAREISDELDAEHGREDSGDGGYEGGKRVPVTSETASSQTSEKERDISSLTDPNDLPTNTEGNPSDIESRDANAPSTSELLSKNDVSDLKGRVAATGRDPAQILLDPKDKADEDVSKFVLGKFTRMVDRMAELGARTFGADKVRDAFRESVEEHYGYNGRKPDVWENEVKDKGSRAKFIRSFGEKLGLPENTIGEIVKYTSAPVSSLTRAEMEYRGKSTPEIKARFDAALDSLTSNGLPIGLLLGALGFDVNGNNVRGAAAFSAKDPSKATGIVMALQDGTKPTRQNFIDLLHEVGHVVFANFPEKEQRRIHKAIQDATDDTLGIPGMDDALLPEGVDEGDAMSEERLMESVALEIESSGFNAADAKGLAKRWWRQVKAYIMRAAMAVQTALFGRANPVLARQYVSLRVRQLLAGDPNATSMLDHLGGRRKSSLELAKALGTITPLTPHFDFMNNDDVHGDRVSEDTSDDVANAMGNELAASRRFRIYSGARAEARREYNAVKVGLIEHPELFRDDDGNLMSKNGVPSKLQEEQWIMVRTESFKEWFGDWENDPDNASRMIDPETGEPRVFYADKVRPDTLNLVSVTTLPEPGYHFSTNITATSGTHPLFLNIREPGGKDSFTETMFRVREEEGTGISPELQAKLATKLMMRQFDGMFDEKTGEAVSFEEGAAKLALVPSTFDRGDNDAVYVSALAGESSSLNEAKRQYGMIEMDLLKNPKKHRDEQGRLLSPTGQPSKLNQKMWVQVRTPMFKAWFGDWERNPDLASKILDLETGEPDVHYQSVVAGGQLGFENGHGQQGADVSVFSRDAGFVEFMGDDRAVYPTYVRMIKPFDVREFGENKIPPSVMETTLKERGVNLSANDKAEIRSGQTWSFAEWTRYSPVIKASIKRSRFDGIRYAVSSKGTEGQTSTTMIESFDRQGSKTVTNNAVSMFTGQSAIAFAGDPDHRTSAKLISFIPGVRAVTTEDVRVIKDQYNQVKADLDANRSQYVNEDGQLLAKDGKVSKLSEEQWIFVRTRKFKQWFGDWESGNSSTMIDEKTGEPKVMWHATQYGNNDPKLSTGLYESATERAGVEARRITNHLGHKFHDTKEAALEDMSIFYSAYGAGGMGNVIPVFVNVRDPKHYPDEQTADEAIRSVHIPDNSYVQLALADAETFADAARDKLIPDDVPMDDFDMAQRQDLYLKDPTYRLVVNSNAERIELAHTDAGHANSADTVMVDAISQYRMENGNDGVSYGPFVLLTNDTEVVSARGNPNEVYNMRFKFSGTQTRGGKARSPQEMTLDVAKYNELRKIYLRLFDEYKRNHTGSQNLLFAEWLSKYGEEDPALRVSKIMHALDSADMSGAVKADADLKDLRDDLKHEVYEKLQGALNSFDKKLTRMRKLKQGEQAKMPQRKADAAKRIENTAKVWNFQAEGAAIVLESLKTMTEKVADDVAMLGRGAEAQSSLAATVAQVDGAIDHPIMNSFGKLLEKLTLGPQKMANWIEALAESGLFENMGGMTRTEAVQAIKNYATTSGNPVMADMTHKHALILAAFMKDHHRQVSVLSFLKGVKGNQLALIQQAMKDAAEGTSSSLDAMKKALRTTPKALAGLDLAWSHLQDAKRKQKSLIEQDVRDKEWLAVDDATRISLLNAKAEVQNDLVIFSDPADSSNNVYFSRDTTMVEGSAENPTFLINPTRMDMTPGELELEYRNAEKAGHGTLQNVKLIYKDKEFFEKGGGLKMSHREMRKFWMQWLDEHEATDGAMWTAVKNQLDSLNKQAEREHTTMHTNMFRQMITPFATLVSRTGTRAGKQIMQRINRYSSESQRVKKDAQTKGEVWDKYEDRAKKALGVDLETIQQYRDYAHGWFADNADWLGELETVDRMAKLRQDMLGDPSMKAALEKSGAWKAFSELVRYDHDITRWYAEVARSLGAGVLDDLLGKDFYRKHVGDPAFHGMKSWNERFQVVAKHMAEAWSGELTKETRKLSKKTLLELADKQGLTAMETLIDSMFVDENVRDRFVVPILGRRLAFRMPFKNEDVQLSFGSNPGDMDMLAQAWRDSGGSMAAFAKKVYDQFDQSNNAELEPFENFLANVADTFGSYFHEQQKLSTEASKAATATGQSPHVAIDARHTRAMPKEWVTYTRHSAQDLPYRATSVVYHGVFGRDSSTMTKLFAEMTSVLNARSDAYVEYNDASEEEKKNLRAAGYDPDQGKKDKRTAAYAKAYKAKFHQLTLAPGNMVEHSSMIEFIGGLAGLMVQSPKTSLIDTLSAFAPIDVFGPGRQSLKMVAGTFNELRIGAIGSLLSVIFKEVKLNAEFQDPLNRYKVQDNQVTSHERLAGRMNQLRLENPDNPGSVFTYNPFTTHNLKAAIRIVETATSFRGRLSKEKSQWIAANPLKFFSWATELMHNAQIIQMWKTVGGLVAKSVEAMQEHDKRVRGAAPNMQFADITDADLTAETLGITGAGSENWLKNMKVLLNEYGYSLSDIAREHASNQASVDVASFKPRNRADQARQVKGLLSPDLMSVLASVSQDKLMLGQTPANSPSWMHSTIARAAMPLIGWQLRRGEQLHKAFNDKETGELTRATLKYGMTSLVSMLPFYMVYALMTDMYDEEILGKKSNRTKIGTGSPLEAYIENMATLGSMGHYGEIANAVTWFSREGDIKGLSIDGRVVAVRTVQTAFNTLSTLFHQKSVSYNSVARPMMMALGGSPYLQYAQGINNNVSTDATAVGTALTAASSGFALGKTIHPWLGAAGALVAGGAGLTMGKKVAEAERISVAKINTDNWLRAAGRAQGAEVRTGAGMYYQPVLTTPHMSKLTRAAYAGDMLTVARTYASAVEAAKEMGKEDPEGYVKQSLRARHPLKRVFMTPPDEQLMRGMYDIMSPTGEIAVKQAIANFENVVRIYAPPSGNKRRNGNMVRGLGAPSRKSNAFDYLKLK